LHLFNPLPKIYVAQWEIEAKVGEAPLLYEWDLKREWRAGGEDGVAGMGSGDGWAGVMSLSMAILVHCTLEFGCW